jgi:arginine decarboxylase
VSSTPRWLAGAHRPAGAPATGRLRHSVLVDTSQAPLAAAYEAALRADVAPFIIPGHKRSTDLLGSVVAGDVPLFAGLDTLRLQHGTLAHAEALAAAAWGADWCRFSVAGSTHGNQALALAVGQPGDTVIVTRALHRSLLLGFVLAGLVPVWLRPQIDPLSGLPLGVRTADVAAALAEHPRARAVFLVEPSYVGTLSDLPAIARVAHQSGVPVVVDAAWGGHLGFHPALPPHALAAGADAFVTSAHKMLPAYTQAALVVARTERLDAQRLERAFDATHTTSPAGSILASIDAARALLVHDGERLLGQTIDLVAGARAALGRVPGVLAPGASGSAAPFIPDRFDATKLVVQVAGTGASGLDLEDDLVEAGLPVEMADRDTLVATVTMADSAETVDRFVGGLTAAIERRRGQPRPRAVSVAWQVTPEPACPPRQAFFADRTAVPILAAVGRIAAELVAPYPPGVPVIAPGERIGVDTVAALQAAASAGTRIAYAADPTLRTLLVLDEAPHR